MAAPKTVIEFVMNDILNGETSITVFNPFKAWKAQAGGRIIKKRGVRQGFMLRNDKIMKFIMELIHKIPYAEYSRRDREQVRVFSYTYAEFTFTMSSTGLKLVREFKKLYKKFS